MSIFTLQSGKRFHIAGVKYQFLAMSFGLRIPPLEFTKVAKELKAFAGFLLIRINLYLDDWLNWEQSQPEWLSCRWIWYSMYYFWDFYQIFRNHTWSWLNYSNFKLFLEDLKGKEIPCENSTAVAYLQYQGGLSIEENLDLTGRIWTFVETHKITLQIRHIPGHLSILADSCH